jgi:hypothetical protein
MKPGLLISRWVLGGTMVMLVPAARVWAADEAETPGARAPAESPQAEAQAAAADAEAREWQERADSYREMGGAIYRSGLPILQHAEDQAESHADQAAELRAPVTNEPMMATPAAAAEAQHYEDLAAKYRRIPSAYRTGFVDWAEREAREREPAGPSVTSGGGGAYYESPPYKPWLNR